MSKSGRITAMNSIGFAVAFADGSGCALAFSNLDCAAHVGKVIKVHFSADGRPAYATHNDSRTETT